MMYVITQQINRKTLLMTARHPKFFHKSFRLSYSDTFQHTFSFGRGLNDFLALVPGFSVGRAAK